MNGPAADETMALPSAELSQGSLFAGRYQVIEELGVGGMGRVYRVLDKKLSEEIALKFIRPEIAADRTALERFASELKLARQVVHRNVARMFDLNEEGQVPYITMEYVRGENLKRLLRKVGRLDAEQAVPVASQICDGLAEAHRLGIVHRDLKPQNVMIDEDGQAKIMDFGLARPLLHEGLREGTSQSGTPAYVSPEQIRGRPADGRSDLYSLGVLLYEMLTGRTPFKAASVKELIEMHLDELPQDPCELNPEIPEALSRVVMKCLEKDPEARYQSAGEVRNALGSLTGVGYMSPLSGVAPRTKSRGLRWLLVPASFTVVVGAAILVVATATGRGPWTRSLAVLPVEEVDASQSHQNLRTDLQDEITDRLSGISGLRVLPSLTVNSHDLNGKTYLEIKKILGVRDLLRLTLAVDGNIVRIKLYLIRGHEDASPAPLTYSKDLSDYRLLQDEISRYTARALDVELAEENLRKIRRRGTDDIEAYNLYLDGKELIEEEYAGLYRDADFEGAVRKLERAIELDPSFSLAYWALGSAYENRYYNPKRTKDPLDLELMYRYFEKASQLDPDSAETNLGLGWYYFNKGDNQRAFDSFKKALALDPRNAEVNEEVGAFLRSLGLYKQALKYLKRAAEIAPHVAAPLIQAAQCWAYLGYFGKAVRAAERAVSYAPDDAEACSMDALVLALAGRLDAAAREMSALKNIAPDYPRLGSIEALLAAAKGERKKALEFKGGLPVLSPPGTYVYVLLGMDEEALGNIEEGIAKGFEQNGMYFYSYPSLTSNPMFDRLSGMPRFQDILKRQKERYRVDLKRFESL